LVQTLAGIKSENDYGRKRRPINQNKLFDCLPRAIPAGLYFYSDPELAFSIGCDLAAITHSHPTGYLATGCLSAIIAFICKGNTIERSVLNTMKILKEHDGFEECFAALDKALSLLDENTSPLTDVAELGNGSTADSALAIGVYCACVHYDYLSAVQLAANQDGISDICAFTAGALKGALLGYSEIPSGFVKKLQFAELIKDYAGRMTKAAPKGFMKK
ncbi:MAG: ADP-ribosylglycohydrolase family protein, partial [[Eubacterium] siraeum]